MKKESVEEFIVKLLQQAGCKSIVVHKDEISAQCPLHYPKRNHKTFWVSTIEKEHKGVTGYFFNCFSCGENGQIPRLIAHIQRCSHEKAIKRFEKRVLLTKVTLESLNKELTELKDSLDNSTIQEIILPSSSKNQDNMYEYMKRRSKRYHRILNVDYIVHKYGLYYCDTGREQGRIIMPIRDMTGRYVCFNDRTINKNVKNKSLHIKNLPYGDLLYGLYENCNKKIGVVIEGAFDLYQVECALSKYKALRQRYGVLGLMGSVMTDTRITLLLQHYDSVILFGDNDSVGVRWTTEAYKVLKEDINVSVCTENIPNKKDPGKCTGDEIIDAIKNPYKPLNKTYLDWMTKKTGFRI